MIDNASQITLQVHDQEGQVYNIHLALVADSGTLAIMDPQGQVLQQHDLSQVQKSHDAKTLACRVGFTSVTMHLRSDTAPPSLHIAARAFLPLFSATYTLSHEEQQRLLAGGQRLVVGLLVERAAAQVQVQELAPRRDIGKADVHLLVEPARAQDGRVERPRLVGGALEHSQVLPFVSERGLRVGLVQIGAEVVKLLHRRHVHAGMGAEVRKQRRRSAARRTDEKEVGSG